MSNIQKGSRRSMWYTSLSPQEAKELKKQEDTSKKCLLSTAKKISLKSPQKDVANFLSAISKHLDNYNTAEIHKLQELVSKCYASIINKKEDNSFDSLKDFLRKF